MEPFFYPLGKKKLLLNNSPVTEVCAGFWTDIIDWSILIDWRAIFSPMSVHFVHCSLHSWNYLLTKSIEQSIVLWFAVDFLPQKKNNFTTCFRWSFMETINKLEDLSVTVFNFNKMRELKICFLLQFAKNRSS